jgi:hypothetical protein
MRETGRSASRPLPWGEVAVQAQRVAHGPDGNTRAVVAGLGLTRKAVHEAQQLRDAEAVEPGAALDKASDLFEKQSTVSVHGAQLSPRPHSPPRCRSTAHNRHGGRLLSRQLKPAHRP